MTQGVGVEWVQAHEGPAVDDDGNGALVAVCAWKEGMLATLEFPVDAHDAFHATVLGREGVHSVTLNISDFYRASMKQILATLRGAASPVSPTEMIEAIQVGAAIELSLQEGRRVYLYEV